MMQRVLIFGLVMIFGCGGSLSEEQREKIRTEMEEKKILKVRDSEIMSAALDQGKTVMDQFEVTRFDRDKTDSLEKLYKVNLQWTSPMGENSRALEMQLIEAYMQAIATGSIEHNIQKVWSQSPQGEYDSLVYSRPVITTLPDGSDKLEGMWNVYLAKRDVILNIGKSNR